MSFDAPGPSDAQATSAYSALITAVAIRCVAFVEPCPVRCFDPVLSCDHLAGEEGLTALLVSLGCVLYAVFRCLFFARFGNSVGCASDWWSGDCGFDPHRIGYILSWRLIMKYL